MQLDFLFSVWLFVWFLAYAAGLTTCSPEIALWIALLFEVSLLFQFYKYGYPLRYAALFVAVNACIKVVPLYLLFGTKPFHVCDIVFGVVLGLAYLVWLQHHRTTVATIYGDVQERVQRHQLLPIEERIVNIFTLLPSEIS